MKILLINPPIREARPAYHEPIGLLSVATALRRAGHQPELLDINCHRFPWEELEGRLPRDSYDMVGLSGLISTYRYLRHAMPILRRVYHDTPIVIGGAGITSAPETYMECLRPDFGVIGEGEITAVELANAVEKGGDTRGMAGLTYFEGDAVRYGPPRALEPDIDTFYPLDWTAIDVDAYAAVSMYHRGKRELSLMATRGCPMACNFCYHVFGRSFRWRTPSAVVEEMATLSRKYGVGAFLMADECLTANRKYLTEFCELLIRRHLDLQWTCFSRVDTVDPNMMALMWDAGCSRIGYGFENGSQRILDAMNKRVTLDQMKRAHRNAKSLIGRVGTTFIFGYPGEDDGSILENVIFQAELDIYNGYYHLQPYPGTTVYDENKDKILAKFGTLDAFFQVLGDAGDFVINLTDWADDVYMEKYKELHRRCARGMLQRHIPPQLYNAACG